MKWLLILVAIVLLIMACQKSETFLSEDTNDKRMIVYLVNNEVPLEEWEPRYIDMLIKTDIEEFKSFLDTDETMVGYFSQSSELKQYILDGIMSLKDLNL